MSIDEKFNRIMLETIKNDIAGAFNSLETEIRWMEPQRALDDTMISIIERKASQMKKEINRYIDSQAERIIEHST